MNVTTPIEGGGVSPPAQASKRRRISATTALASIGLVRSSRPAPERWKVPLTRTSEMPRPSGPAEARPCVGAGNEDSRFS